MAAIGVALTSRPPRRGPEVCPSLAAPGGREATPGARLLPGLCAFCLLVVLLVPPPGPLVTTRSAVALLGRAAAAGALFLSAFGHSSGGPNPRGLGGCSRVGALPCLGALLGPGSQSAGFLGGRGGQGRGGGFRGHLSPLPGSGRGAAVPSRGLLLQRWPRGQAGEGGLCLHPQQVLRQGCLLPALLVATQLLLQLLEEACEGQGGSDPLPSLAGRR